MTFSAVADSIRIHRRGVRRDAYVMLAVIAVSVLVITLLSMLATLSLRRGLEAADAERSLQQRWGSMTLQSALLRQAPKLFERREELADKLTPGHPPAPYLRDALTLRGVTFDIMLGDEDAKLNLNSLYHHIGQNRLETAINQVVSPMVANTLRLLPAVEPMQLQQAGSRSSLASVDDSDAEESQQDVIQDAFRSWGEVFRLPDLEWQSGTDAALPNATTGITCWGNGQLNFRRASDEAILAVVGSVIQDGAARRLVMRYRQSPTATLAVILQTEVSNSKDRDRLSELMSETSTNFSVWVDASSASSGSLRTFTVNQRDSEGVTRQSRFVH